MNISGGRGSIARTMLCIFIAVDVKLVYTFASAVNKLFVEVSKYMACPPSLRALVLALDDSRDTLAS
jgi:hypothetical protein